ncbi:hypothetical protein IGI04_012691 [Brassica rapa subsp. trilocularis]|uniref:Uncharacterized protein n=1 Tax=Brassica rapa subsp. trilocularis TaxID=1813537 RepID=A0ABQ7N6N3_BRACM|nr:hypothetical protein IGI04_012691 [Brassica rapa subsp. trilocularis]
MNRNGIRTTEGLVGSMGKRGGRSVQKRQVRIEAPVRLSHAESWREGVVIHCKGYGLHPREPDAGCTRAGDLTGTQQERGGTISGNADGKEGNAPETHGTRNGTHGDVGKVDMCVLNPAPWNPGWKWGGTGVSIGEFDQLRVSGPDQINQKVLVPQCGGVSEVQEWPDIRAWGKRLAGNTAPHRAGEAGEGESDTRPRHAQLHGGIKPCQEMDFWHSDITVKLVPYNKKKKRRGEVWARVPPPGRGPADAEGANRGGQGRTDETVGENRFQIMGTRLRIILGMSSPVHHELGERRMRYGPKGTRAYARKPYRDAWGDVVPALFPDEEEVEFVEPPNAPIQETTVGRRILMPHFQRAAEYRRLYQGQGTFQFAPEADMTPPTRGRGRPRKTGPTREGLGPIRMEDSVPTRKRGRPRKIPSIDAESLRRIPGICQCGTLTQARRGPRSVREYTEEFLESAKRCKPKSAEDWCRWYTAGLREEIRGKLIGVLEPWEFALVNRMAGQAMEAGRTLARRVVAISSSEEDVEVEEDPSEDSAWEEEPASSTGSGRVAGPKPDGEQKSPVRKAKPCREVPEIRNPSRRLLPSLSLRRLSSLSLSSPRLFSLSPRRASFSLSDDSLSPRREQPRVVVCDTENGWRLKRKVRKSLRV